MYKISIPNKKVMNKLESYIQQRENIRKKLDSLKENPRKNCGAHPLKGKLEGKWACWLGSNIRAMYIVDDLNKIIIITSIGTHKIY